MPRQTIRQQIEYVMREQPDEQFVAEIVVHDMVSDSSVEARVIISFYMPDGRCFEHNDVKKFQLKLAKDSH